MFKIPKKPHIGPVDSRWPPESESTIRNLIQTGSLRICEFLEFHRLLESGRALPEQTLPRWEVGALKMFISGTFSRILPF